jgi:autotransporter translocation and assembly factor TamB
MRRATVAILIASGIGAILAIAVGTSLWMRSAHFDRFLERTLNDRVRPLHLRIELAEVSVSLWRGLVELRDVRVFPGHHRDPVLRIPHVRARIAIEDLFARAFSLTDLQLDRPQILITVDPNGRPNIADIDLSEFFRPRAPRPYTLRLRRAEVTDGRFFLNDQRHHFHLRAEGVLFSLAPAASAPRASGAIRQLDLVVDDSVIARAHMEWRAEVARDHVRLERVRIASDAGDVLVAGTIRGWAHPHYDLALEALVHLDRVAANWPSPVALAGDLALRGRVRGQGSTYRLDVTATMARATLWGMRITGGSGRIHTPDTESATGSVGARVLASATVETLVKAFFGARGVSVTGTLPGPAGWLFAGTLQGRAATIGPLPLDRVRARVRVGPEHALVEDLDVQMLGGHARGFARIRFSGDSEAHVRFEGVSARDLIACLASRSLPLEGEAHGVLTLRWPDWAIARASGALAMTLAPPPVPTTDALPVQGALDATLSPRALAVRTASFVVGRSRAAVSGTVSWEGDVDLVLRVRAEEMSEQQRVLDALGYRLRTLTHGLVPQLSGTAEYSLRFTKRGTEYAISGEGEMSGLVLGGERVRSLRARFAYARGRWHIEAAHLLWETGARAELALETTEESGVSVRAQLRRVPLERWLKALGLELPLSGRLSGEIALVGVPGIPTGTARILIEDGAFSLGERPLRFRRLMGTVHLDPPRYEIRDAQLAFAFGTIVLSGSLRSDDGAYAFRARGEDIDLATVMRMAMRRAPDVGGQIAFALSGQGTLSDPRFSGDLRVHRLVIAGRPAGEIAAELTTRDGHLQIPITATLFGQTQTFLGALDLTDPALVLRVRAQFREFALTPYLRLIRRLAEWRGAISGDLQLEWPLGAWETLTASRRRGDSTGGVRATLALSKMDLAINEYALQARRPFALHMQNSRLRIEPVALIGENTSLELSGTLDLGELFDGRPSSGHELDVNGSVDLRLLRGLYAGLFASGRATIRASLRGSFEEPRLSGLMEIEDLALRVLDWPVALTQGQGRIRFTAAHALIENLRARANEGEVTVSGGLLLRHLRADQWRIVVRSEAVVLAYPPGLRSVVDGTLTLQGNRQVQVLSGTITVRRSEYTQDVDVAQLILAHAGERARPSLPAVPIHPPLSLDIRVQALDTLIVRNNLADAVGSASLHVGGTLASPLISGNVVVTRGVVRFRNREYQITRGRIDFPREGTTRGAPRFQIEAESDIAGYRVIVGFLGTLDRFQTTLRSEPALPPEQILSLIATGELSQRAASSATPSAGLGTAATLLIGELTHRAQEFTGKVFGINRFQVDPLIVGRGSDPTARLTIGRQINRNLSLLYATNLSGPQEQVIIVEYRLSDRFSLVGTRDQDGNFSFDLRIRKRF